MRTTQWNQWKWMALGGLLCLLAIVVISRWRDNQAIASNDQGATVALPLIGSNPVRTVDVPPALPAVPAEVAGERPAMPPSDSKTEPPMLPPIGSIAPPLTLPQIPAATPITTLPMPKDPPATPQPLPLIQTTGAIAAPQMPGAQGGGLIPAGFREQSPATTAPALLPAQVPTLSNQANVSTTPISPAANPPLTPPLTPPAGTEFTTPVAPLGRDPLVDPKLNQPQVGNILTVPEPIATPPAQPVPLQVAPTRPLAQPITAPPTTQPSEPGEPPLTATGPTQVYRVRHAGETVREIARKTLGTVERSTEIFRLNPELRNDKIFGIGESVYLPADACIPTEDVEAVRPLPAMRREVTSKPKVVLPLTGTFPCNLDDKRVLTLPRSIREQLGNTPTLLISPGPDQCLWLTNQSHLDRLAERLEKSAAREVDVRVFKRLYYAQTEKIALTPEGRIAISDRLAQFAGLHQEVVLVGIDDHFELWDVSRWRQYTQEKSAASRGGNDSE